MRFIHSPDSLVALNRPCAATIGSFDAIHVGHRVIIKKTMDIAKKNKLPSVVLMFEPLPREFFADKDNIPKRIYTLRRRIELIQELGVDYLVCLNFTRTLANWTADEFVQQIILNGLCVRHLVVGDDFHFGKNREGDYNMLSDYGKRCGFELSRIPTVEVGNIRISSTVIRNTLLAGKFSEANLLLGEPYSVSGRIKRGERLGAQLGCPTANLTFRKQQPPLSGVFVVTAEVCGLHLKGISNAGTRPTVDGKQYQIETHIFDFSKDLYGERLTIYPLHYLRKEKRHADMDQLKNAIQKDVEAAQSYLAAN